MDDTVLAQLKHYEELLREHGIDPTSPSSVGHKKDSVSEPQEANPSESESSQPAKPTPWTYVLPYQDPDHDAPSLDPSQGQLITDHGRSRFIEK
jgi:hypothetical protein